MTSKWKRFLSENRLLSESHHERRKPSFNHTIKTVRDHVLWNLLKKYITSISFPQNCNRPRLIGVKTQGFSTDLGRKKKGKRSQCSISNLKITLYYLKSANRNILKIYSRPRASSFLGNTTCER